VVTVKALSVKALYVSSSIGLGHVAKDLAIARELRRLRPDVEILWLAGHPASEVLRSAGENVLPEAERWRGASAIAERCTRDGQLNLVPYVYRSLPSWMANARLFRAVLESRAIDVAIGNEAYEVDIPLILRILRLRIPFVMIFDFVATDPMTARLVERLGAWCLNALWSLDAGIYDGDPHSALFIGEIDDVPSRPFGLALGDRRKHALDHYEVVGHVIGFDVQDYADRGAWRRRLGYGQEPLIVCSAGGTSIGRDLLELCGQAFLPLRDEMPDAHMVLVCGPRLASESLRVPDGVTVLGYVPRLYEHYACCDVAVVQCGASSTTEISALRRPFIHFPIDGHFEQEVVARRLARYGAGRRMSLKQTTPTQLAAAIRQECGRVATWDVLPVEGARLAAQHVLRALEGRFREAARSAS
jgi:Glycosyltransferase family 28 C-terminal domain